MQRSLVRDRAMDDGGAVAVVGEAQPVKPGGPSGIEVPLEADFVTSGLMAIVSRSACFAHRAPLRVSVGSTPPLTSPDRRARRGGGGIAGDRSRPRPSRP